MYYILLPDSISFETGSVQVATSKAQGEEVGVGNRKGPSLVWTQYHPELLESALKATASPCVLSFLVLK